MASTITHTQVRETTFTQYQVTDTATDATPTTLKYCFVFRTSDSTYNRIATVEDIAELPTAPGTEDYYRQAQVIRTFDVLAEAQAFATEIESRLKSLVVEYDKAANDFIGTTTETISS